MKRQEAISDAVAAGGAELSEKDSHPLYFALTRMIHEASAASADTRL